MKKVLSLFIIFTVILSSVWTMAASLEIDGVKVDGGLIFTDSTVYIPLSSVAKAISAPLDWDEKTQTAFLNGINLFAKDEGQITVFVNGKKYTPSDTSLSLFTQDGEIYLPAHLAAEALGKEATWFSDTATLVLSTPQTPVTPTVINENTVYAIVNRGTGKVLSSTGNSLTTEAYNKNSEAQKFKIVKTEFDGYYHIKAVSTGYNLDVNAHGTTPGVSIITWEQGTGDNQKFKIEDVLGGSVISARSCHLPIEPNQNGVIQNTPGDSLNQKWSIIPFDSYTTKPLKKAQKLVVNYTPKKEELIEKKAPYRFISIDSLSLSDRDGLKVLASDSSASQKWTLVEYSADVYVITNLETNKSVDVSARSLEKGGSIITYNTSSDANQRWVLEQNGDGTYYIKSVHSSLYLTVSDNGGLIQDEKNTALKQRWKISETE